MTFNYCEDSSGNWWWWVEDPGRDAPVAYSANKYIDEVQCRAAIERAKTGLVGAVTNKRPKVPPAWVAKPFRLP